MSSLEEDVRSSYLNIQMSPCNWVYTPNAIAAFQPGSGPSGPIFLPQCSTSPVARSPRPAIPSHYSKAEKPCKTWYFPVPTSSVVFDSTSVMPATPPPSFSFTYPAPLRANSTRVLLEKRQRRPRSFCVAVMRPFSGPLKILNGRGGGPASPPETPSSLEISAELKKRIQFLYAAHVTPSGVDYSAMKQSPEFAAYAAYTRLLPALDLTTALPDDAHKISFYVNLYNALTQHAVVVLGAPPSASVFRLFFCLMAGYAVGPFRLSLNDIENGVLRANRSVSVLPKPFTRRDPRRALCVSKVDPRIHFVLNCAANSCPPVLFLTPENVEGSLQIAARGFLNSKDNLEVLENRVLLSRIFDWYRGDFSKDGSDRGLLEFVAAHGQEGQPQVKEVKRILKAFPDKVTVEWKPYDWALNSS